MVELGIGQQRGWPVNMSELKEGFEKGWFILCVGEGETWLPFYQRMPSVSQSPLGMCCLSFTGSEGKFGVDRFCGGGWEFSFYVVELFYSF